MKFIDPFSFFHRMVLHTAKPGRSYPYFVSGGRPAAWLPVICRRRCFVIVAVSAVKETGKRMLALA